MYRFQHFEKKNREDRGFLNKSLFKDKPFHVEIPEKDNASSAQFGYKLILLKKWVFIQKPDYQIADPQSNNRDTNGCYKCHPLFALNGKNKLFL